MKNGLRTIVFVLLILIHPLIVIGQEGFDQKVNKIIDKLIAETNIKEPITVKIDLRTSVGINEDIVYFSTLDNRPTISINQWFFTNASESGLNYILAHELGHYFDPAPRSNSSRYGRRDRCKRNCQILADAFALYMLGEDLFKIGAREYYFMFSYNYFNHLEYYDNTRPYYAQYAAELALVALNDAKSVLPEIPYLISLRNNNPINPN